MNTRPGRFLGALCPSVCSFLTGLGLHRAAVSCSHPHHRCCSLHVLFAAGQGVLANKALKKNAESPAAGKRDEPWTWWEQAASGSPWEQAAMVVLVSHTAPEPPSYFPSRMHPVS